MKIEEIVEGCEFIEGTKILRGKMHPEIHDEILDHVRECEKIQSSPLLAALFDHKNVGNNKYQQSFITSKLIDSAFYRYFLYIGTWYANQVRSGAQFSVNDQYGQRAIRPQYANKLTYDQASWWINWADKDSENKRHIHRNSITSVVYIENSHLAPTMLHFDDREDIEYNGADGEFLLFPGHQEHSVKKIEDEGIRVTAAFNMTVVPDDQWQVYEDFIIL